MTHEFPREFTADSSGAIRNKSGRRLLMLDADMWKNSKREFYSAFDLGADALLFHVGRAYGRTIGKDWKGATQKELIRNLEGLIMSLGWGRARVRSSGKGSRERIIVENCVFCEDSTNGKRPRCQELEGVISGAVAWAIGHEYSVKEVACIGMGNETCEFEIAKSEVITDDLKKSTGDTKWK
ncbi:MAG: hypothetical protein JRN52_01470 [Nitrososphaerota archaeon]|nr:hypothetical protein [Nitrososphaerota archaeon]